MTDKKLIKAEIDKFLDEYFGNTEKMDIKNEVMKSGIPCGFASANEMDMWCGDYCSGNDMRKCYDEIFNNREIYPLALEDIEKGMNLFKECKGRNIDFSDVKECMKYNLYSYYEIE